VKYYRKGSAFAGKIKSVDSGETIPHAETSSRAAWKVRRGKEFTRMTPTKWDVEGEPIEMGPSIGISRMGPEDRPKQKPWPDFEIHPDYHGHAELADAIKSARILLRHGVDGDTPVAVMAAYTQHQPNWTSTRPWTVRELADHQPPQISLTRLRDEATPRGIETYVDGPRMILRAADGSWEKTFDSHLAAARFVEKMPGRVLDRPLDDAFEQALGIGKSRSFDADVDAGAFHKVDLQETATKELIAGKRPLIVLHGEDPTSISNAIRAIEMMNDLPPGTHTVLPLKGTGHGKNAVAIYDTLRARQMLGSVKEDVARLGVNTEQPFQDVLQELSNKKWGLAALFGRPEGPQQALHYSWLREHGMRESWTRGKLTQDSMGPYRTFDPNEILLSRRGGPGSMFAGGEPPPPYNPTLDLEDVIPGFHPDARMHMPPGPGMAEPEHPGWYGDMHPETEDATYHDWGWGKGDEAAEAAEATGGDAGGGGEGGGGGGLPTGPPDTPEQKRIAEGFKSVFSGPFNQLAHFFRVPAEMFKEWEVRSGIPFSTWFTAIEDRRSAVEATMGPLMENMHELFRGTTQDLREAAQQVFDAHATGKMQDIAHITDDAALALGEKAHEFFTRWMTETMGHSKEDVEALLKELPQIRKSGQSFSDYKGSRGLGLPKLLTTESKSFEKGAVILSNREMDVRKNLIRMGRAFTNEKEMMPTWSAISKAYQAYKMVDTPLTDSGAFTVFDSYIRSALHQQDHVSNTIANVFKKVAEKLEGIGVISDADATDFTSVILGAGYFANMAFGPGNVMRNALQTLQTGTGLGVGPWAHGFKQAMKYLRDPDFEQELLHRGIITRDRTAQMWADARGANEMIMNLEGSSSKIIANTTRLASMGTAPFKKVEDLNHIIAYYSQHQLAEKFGKQYHAGKITWDEFLEKSYIDMRDMKDGPTHRGIKEALDAGEIDVAADIASIDYMNATQFKYRRGVTPYWMQNTVGRMAGQYGTWPSYFAEYAYDSMTRGSVKNRMKVAARWAAANAAMYEIGSQAFGVDMGRWLFFSPFGYTGGPMVEVAGQALSTTNMLVQGQIDMTGQAKKGADPADAIALARFKNSWQQFVPLPTGQYNRTMRALDQIQLGDWSKGTKYFLGFPPIKDTY
jgi:hypothetical protein